MLPGPFIKEIKKARRRVDACCTHCMKPGKDYKCCGRCKTPLYCSKECQRANWPLHKSICTPGDISLTVTIIKNLIVNELLTTLLGAILCMIYNLPKHKMRRVPFKVRLGFVIEPVKLEDLDALLKSESEDEDNPEPIMGMLQLTNIILHSVRTPLEPSSLNLSENARKQLDDTEGSEGGFVGIVEFTNNDVVQKVLLPAYIHPESLAMVRDSEPAVIPISRNGDTNATIEKPMSIVSYMEYVSGLQYFVAHIVTHLRQWAH